MMRMGKKLVCCTHNREISHDLDKQETIVTYNGLESCILNSYENESPTNRGDCGTTDSLDEDASSCSSSNYIFGSFSSPSLMMKKDDDLRSDIWEVVKECPKTFSSNIHTADVETMKMRFAKLLLGEDITGGKQGVSSAYALSKAITTLSASLFGELWKLEPMDEERKERWRREMGWLLSPTNFMIELVPIKQTGNNGCIFETMTPKARADIQMNLPALQKLDSILIETLDSMDTSEFWYEETGKRADGDLNRTERRSRRWWLPLPQVPKSGLSMSERKKLINNGKIVCQVYKAARSINESVLLEIPVPTLIMDAIPKSGKENLGEELYYKLLNKEEISVSAKETLESLNLKSETVALETANRLEAAVLAWTLKMTDQANGKSPFRTSCSSFTKDPLDELDKIEFLVAQAKALIKQLKIKYPNLPQTFLEVVKIQYGKDVGHAILEAYSRALGNLAYKILSRITDILQEDTLSSTNSPVPTPDFQVTNFLEISDSPILGQKAEAQ